MKAVVVLLVLAMAGAAQTTTQELERQRFELWVAAMQQDRDQQRQKEAERHAGQAHVKELIQVGDHFADLFNAYREIQAQGGTAPKKLKEVVKAFNKWLDTEEGRR